MDSARPAPRSCTMRRRTCAAHLPVRQVTRLMDAAFLRARQSHSPRRLPESSQSARSLVRAMAPAPGRTPLGRPAIPIDIAAFSYHWSVLKIARRIFFFSGLVRDRDFLALVDLEAVPFEGMFFA